MSRVLETVLTGRNLLSPVLAKAGSDVVAFNSTVTRANAEAASSAGTSAAAQQTAASAVEAANAKAAAAAKTNAAVQTAASKSTVAANVAGADAAAVAAALLAAASGEAASAAAESSESQQASFSDVQEKAAEYAEKIKGAHSGASASAAEGAGVTQAANARSATSAAQSSTTQVGAGERVVASNTTTTASTTTSSQRQIAAHRATASSATLSARAQEAANTQLAASNGLVAASMAPLAKALGVGALAIGYMAYRGMEFETSMSQVQAASQETGATLDSMRDAAIDAGAKTQYSAVEAAQGITEMSKAGVSAKDILGGGLAGALNLAAAGQMEVADAAETGATALSVFGLKGDQMSHVADLLAAGAGKAQGSVGDLSAALNQSALVASQAGLSIEDTTGALAMFAHNGLVGSDAGTSFKTMLQALTPNSEKAAKVMAEMGLSAFDAQGNFVGLETYAGQLQTALSGMSEEQRNSTLEIIFGSDAVRAASVLYKEGSAGVAQWAGNVDDAGYAARQAAQLTDNLSGDLERAGGALDALFTSVGGAAQGPLRLLVQGFTGLVDILGTVIGFISDLPGPVMVGVAALTALWLINGPLLGALTNTALVMASMAGQAMATAGSVGVLGASMGFLRGAASGVMGIFGGPWGLAIAGAVTGLSLLVSWLGKSDEGSDDAAASADNLTSALQQTKGAIDDVVRAAAAKDLQEGGLLNWAEEWGVASGDIVDAALGSEEALARVREGAIAYAAAQREAAAAANKQAGATGTTAIAHGSAAVASEKQYKALLELLGVTEEEIAAQEQLTGATTGTGGAMEATTEQTEEATKAHEAWLESLQKTGAAFVDPLAVYTGLLDEKTAAERDAAEKTAASTEDSSDSWKDYVGDVKVSLAEYATELENQLLAQENWRTNIGTITRRGGLEVGQAIEDMGVEGVQLAAQMANGTDAEFQRMAGLIVEDTRRGGADAAVEFDNAMKVMAAIGAAGADATAVGIARQLGLGLANVRGIAAQYGVELATGLEPLMTALGNRNMAYLARGEGMRGSYPTRNADGNLYEDHQAEIAPGGAWRIWAEPETGGEAYIPLAASKRDRSMNIWRETGKRLNAPEAQYFAWGGISDVPRPRSTAPYGPPVSTAGDATMQAAYDETVAWMRGHIGVAGTGAVGGAWGSLWQLVKSQIPQARMNSTYRAGDPGYHGRGKAIDFGFGSGPGGAGSAGLASINRLLHDQVGANLAELIYDGAGDDRPDLKNGRPLTYSAATRAQHAGHVHAAVADTGGVMAPGTAHLNLSGRPERTLSPQQTEAFDRWLTSPAAMPGYGMAAGGGGGAGGGGKVTVSLEGATVTGRFEFGSDGLVTLVDGRINGRFEDLYREKVLR